MMLALLWCPVAFLRGIGLLRRGLGRSLSACGQRPLLLALLISLVLGGSLIPAGTQAATQTLQQDTFTQTPAIWPSSTSTSSHQIVLFRNTFTVTEAFTATELAIFADTRYEAWIDDTLVGRGPARFSRLTHEYDRYQLGTLEPGEHLIAILVQWAPNQRRSESTAPYLQARLEGDNAAGHADHHAYRSRLEGVTLFGMAGRRKPRS